MNRRLLASGGAGVSLLVAAPAAFAQTAGSSSSGDQAIDTAVSGGLSTLTSHIGTWAPELIGLFVLVAALTYAMTWVKKRA